MVRHIRIPGRRLRPRLAALAGASVMALLIALPVIAADGAPTLTNGSISPSSGKAGTAFTVRVTYTSTGHGGHGWQPSYVTVWLGPVPVPMQAVDPTDSDYQDGAIFGATVKPAAGTYPVIVRAADSRTTPRTAVLDLGSLTVGPAATPTPRPTSKPTPTPAPTLRPTPRPTPAPTPSPSESPVEPSGFPGLILPPPATSPSPGSSATDGPAPVASPSAAGAGQAGGGSGNGSAAALTAGLPPIGSPAWLELLTRQMAVAVGGTTMVAMALFTFRRRQQDAADGDGAPAPDAYAAPPPLSEQLAAEYVALAPLGDMPGESDMPRWRRPSLRAARESKGTDLRAIEAQRMTFGHTEDAVSHGLERRRLRYRMVRLSETPDEIRSTELALLDQGDEVELLQQSGAYWQVSTPTGLVGWVHRMTLGEVVDQPMAPAPPPWQQAAAASTDPDAADPPASPTEPADADPYNEGLAQRLVRERFTL